MFPHIFRVSREAGSPGELIPGHRDRAKSQWAAGEVAAVLSFQSTLSSKENRAAPRLSAQLSCVFSTPQWDKKDRACQNQGSVFTSSMSFQSSKKITQNQSENRRGLTSQGQLWGEETVTTLLSRIPGGPRDLAFLHIGDPLTTAMVFLS